MNLVSCVIFSFHTPATHTNLLFSDDFLPMPPTFAETYIFGWHFLLPHFFCKRPVLLGVVVLFRARGLAKATRPLTCTHFDPRLFLQICPLFLSVCTFCQQIWETVFAKSPQIEQKGIQTTVFIYFFQTRSQIATRMLTGVTERLRRFVHIRHCLSTPQ